MYIPLIITRIFLISISLPLFHPTFPFLQLPTFTNLNRLTRGIISAFGRFFNQTNDGTTGGYAAEDDVFVVEVRGGNSRDEELGTVCSWTYRDSEYELGIKFLGG